MLFVDGLGLGEPGPRNPLDADYPALRWLAGGQRWTSAATSVRADRVVFTALDATLGLPGLPQSGTGQVALLTGYNAARLMGRHFGPWAPRALWPLLDRENLFSRVRALGLRAQLANAYPPVFFEALRRSGRWSVMSRAAWAAGLRLQGVADVLGCRALTADMTGAAWRERLKLPVPELRPEEAGRRWHALGRGAHVCLFEYPLPDRAGHEQDPARARLALERLDRFLMGYLSACDPESDLLLLCSDHGNVEDLSWRGHTRNLVPLVAFGAAAGRWDSIGSIAEVVPVLCAVLREGLGFGQLRHRHHAHIPDPL